MKETGSRNPAKQVAQDRLSLREVREAEPSFLDAERRSRRHACIPFVVIFSSGTSAAEISIHRHISCGHISCGHISCGHISCGHISCGHISCGHISCGHIRQQNHLQQWIFVPQGQTRCTRNCLWRMFGLWVSAARRAADETFAPEACALKGGRNPTGSGTAETYKSFVMYFAGGRSFPVARRLRVGIPLPG